MTRVSLAHLAAAIDQAGTLKINKVTTEGRTMYVPNISLARQRTPTITVALFERFGGKCYPPPGVVGRSYSWRARKAAAGRAVKALLPHLDRQASKAELLAAVADINARMAYRRFVVPAVIDGEPLVPLRVAAEAAGVTHESALQASQQGTIPCARVAQGRRFRIFVPESYIPTWAERGSVPPRPQSITDKLEDLYQQAFD